MSKKIGSYEDFPLEELQLYAGIDALVTSKLRNRLMPALTRERSYETLAGTLNMGSLYERDIRAVKSVALDFLIELEYTGIGFDIDYYFNLRQEVEHRLEALRGRLAHLKFNLSSGPQLQDYVYKERGFVPRNFTAKGQPSVDYDSLVEFEDEEINLIAQHNELQSLFATFLNSYHLNVKSDGRIHPNYNLHGTSSHRITGNNPNLTQIPKDTKGISVRSCFAAPKGYLFFAADQSSAEVKVLAAICRDANLLKAVRDDLDFHSYTAALLMGMPYEEFVDILTNGSKEQKVLHKTYRQNAKAVTFAILYGSTVRSVAMKLGKDLSETQELFDLYFRNFPGIKDYVEDSHYAAKQNCQIITELGQIRQEIGLYPYFGPKGPSRAEAVYNYSLRNSQNVRIQSTSSTLGLLIFSELAQRIKQLGGRAVCTVYDSVELEVPEQNRDAAVKMVKETMEDWPQQVIPWLDFPIRVDIEVGTSWGNAEKIGG